MSRAVRRGEGEVASRFERAVTTLLTGEAAEFAWQ